MAEIKVIPMRDTRGRFTGYWTITGAAEHTPSRATAVKWAALHLPNRASAASFARVRRLIEGV